MDIMNIVLTCVPNVIESIILWRLMSYVLEPKYGGKTAVLAATGMFLLLQIKQVFAFMPAGEFYQMLATLLVLIYSLLVILSLSNNSFIEKLIWWGIYALGLILLEIGLMFAISAIMNKSVETVLSGDEISGIVIIAIKLLTLLAFEFIFRMRKGKLVIGLSYFWELAMVIVFNLVLALILLFIYYNRRERIVVNDVIVLFFGVVLLITAYSVALIFRIEKRSNEELATKLRLKQIELELQLNNDMIHITDNLRKLRHDLNNHIGLIKTLAHTEKYEELKEYINQVYEDVEIANDLVIINNKTLSVLLNAKKGQAKEKNINFTSMIAIQDINMQSKDICSLLGNILDNAIEAAEKSGNKKYIQLMIQNTEKGCSIQCENSISTKPVIKRGRFLTNKDNALLHGLGTENIKDIVAKYQGELEFEFDDESFHIQILLPV